MKNSSHHSACSLVTLFAERTREAKGTATRKKSVTSFLVIYHCLEDERVRGIKRWILHRTRPRKKTSSTREKEREMESHEDKCDIETGKREGDTHAKERCSLPMCRQFSKVTGLENDE